MGEQVQWVEVGEKVFTILPTRDVPNIRVSDPNIRVGEHLDV